MKIVFMGSPEFAVDTLAALHKEGKHELLAVVTQPDRPKGRGRKILTTAVKDYSLQAALPVLQPEKVRSPEFIAQLKALRPDLIVVVAFGQLLPREILDLPRLGCLNVHASLLPKYRGAAPIHYAILRGEAESGVTVMQMDEGMDTGAMLAKYTVSITQDMTMGDLHDILKAKGAELLLKVLSEIEKSIAAAVAQNNSEATYAALLTKKIERINWNLPAGEVHNKVRGLNPWPGAYTLLPNGRKLKLWRTRVIESLHDGCRPGEVAELTDTGFVVACGEGFVEVLEVQPESGKKMPAATYCNGHKLNKGIKFIIEG